MKKNGFENGNGYEGTDYTERKNLAAVRPDLAAEWNSDRNSDLSPTDVTAHSRKIVWWRCQKGHEWRAAVYNRSEGSGCPYCSGLKK